jgi:hypothetical protein
MPIFLVIVVLVGYALYDKRKGEPEMKLVVGITIGIILIIYTILRDLNL